MERLTTPGYRYYDDEFMDSGVAKYMNRLSAYENTGLKPERIEELIELFTDDKVVELARILRKAFECGEVDHIRDLLQAEQDGRLVVLPSKTVWELTMDAGPDCDMKCPTDVWGESLGCDLCSNAKQFAYERPCTQALLKELGKTVFLTREEAEAAMAEKDSAVPDAPEEPAEPEWKSRVMRTFLGGRET